MKSVILSGLAAACLLAAGATAASAHATFEVSEAKPGATWKAVLRVPHGCKGEATREVRIQIPEGLHSVKPMPKAGWTLETATGAYAKTYMNHGTAVKDGVKEIVWKGALEDAHYDEFVFRAAVAADFKPGAAVPVPVVQICANGAERWIEVAAPGQDAHALKAPAPVLRIAGAAAAAEAKPMGRKVGDLTLTAPWARATPPGAKAGGAFMEIRNGGQHGDRLVSARSDVAGVVEIHEMGVIDGIMKMRALDKGLPLPAGETVTLKPGGFHVMLMELKRPLVAGEKVKATLTFEKSGTVDVEFDVAPIGAMQPAAGMDHSAH